jgi:hypothetical protein
MQSEQMMRNRLMERVLQRNTHDASSARALQEVRAIIQAAEAAEAAKAAEARAGTERAMERIKKKLDAKHAAQDALSLAKKAKTPEDMLAKAETAIAMYMEYKKHMTSRCSDFDAQIDFAKKIAELAQRELDKPLIQRWLEEHWELIITG